MERDRARRLGARGKWHSHNRSSRDRYADGHVLPRHAAHLATGKAPGESSLLLDGDLVPGERIVPELIQDDLTASNLARAAEALLDAPERIAQMRLDLARVRKMLTLEGEPLRRAAEQIVSQLTEKRGFTHANC